MVAGRGVFVHTAGPNVALIKSPGRGMFARNKEVQIVIGGRILAVPVIHRVDSLSLELRTITVKTHGGATNSGVLINVNSCCQVKIRAWHPPAAAPGKDVDPNAPPEMDHLAIKLAAQHFIGKKTAEIESAIQATLEGHQRAIIGTLSVESLINNRKAFSDKVLELATQDMRDMGLSVVSYTVSEITDEEGYVYALGAKQRAVVNAQATIGKAENESQAKSVSAEREADAHVKVNLQRRLQIESDRDRDITQAESSTIVEQKRAVQSKAGQIQAEKENAVLFAAQQHALAVQANAELKVEKEKVEKQRLIMQQQVHTEADAMLYKAQKSAEGIRATAVAEAERIRLIGQAEADVQEAMSKVQMTVLQRKVEIWNSCTNNAALVEKALEILPQIASSVAEPLAKTEKMVFVGSGGGGGGGPSAFAREFEKIAAEIPETIPALTGFDIKKALHSLAGTATV